MIVRAHAKINLGLAVGGVRPDGYHDISTVMQSVKLSDTLVFQKREEPGLFFRCSEKTLPSDEGNLSYRAAALLLGERLEKEGLSIELEKNIPLAAGLAGGSADAAATLYAVNELFALGLSTEELLLAAKKLGADVPFCLVGGTCLCEGIGEILTPAPSLPPCYLVLAKPKVMVSTKEAYGGLAPVSEREEISMDRVLSALEEKNFFALDAAMKNAFEEGVIAHHPEVGSLLAFLKEEGALCCRMSGSGPTVFGIFEEEEKAVKAKDAALKAFSLSDCLLTMPSETGVEGGTR